MNRSLIAHHCVSNELGNCAECRADGLTLGSPVRLNVRLLRKRRVLVSARIESARVAACLAKDAKGMGLDSLVPPLVRLVLPLLACETQSELAECESKMARYETEIRRAGDGRRAREARTVETKRRARSRSVALQAERIAKRGSMALEWTVAMSRPRRGHRDVKVAKVVGHDAHGEAQMAHADGAEFNPRQQWRESKVARRVRGDAPALLFREAQDICTGIQRKLSQGARSTRRA